MNKQIIIVAAAGLLTGLGGGTGLKVMTAPPPAEVTEDGGGVAADSTAAHADGPVGPGDMAEDTLTMDQSGMGHEVVPVSMSDDDGAEVQDTGAAGAQAQPLDVDNGQDDSAEAGADADPTARLSRLLGAMRPEEAAKILEPLNDDQVKKVLFALPERKAAAILAKFKGERAAALARAIIEHAGTP